LLAQIQVVIGVCSSRSAMVLMIAGASK